MMIVDVDITQSLTCYESECYKNILTLSGGVSFPGPAGVWWPQPSGGGTYNRPMVHYWPDH